MFPINSKVMESSGNIISQSFILEPGVYVFTATFTGTGSTQLKFTIGSSTGEQVATYSWGNSLGSITHEYVISQQSTWVTMYANAAVTYSNMMLCRKSDYEASSTYVPYAPTNRQLYISQTGYTAESANGSFAALIHDAATYCGVDDTQEVNGFVVFTSSVTSENLIGFFNFKYTRNVVFSPIISNTITYSNQSQYGTIVVTGGTGPYKAVVKFI